MKPPSLIHSAILLIVIGAGAHAAQIIRPGAGAGTQPQASPSTSGAASSSKATGAASTPRMTGPLNLGTVVQRQNRAIISKIRVLNTNPTPNTAASKMDRPGPVRSPDTYFTVRIGSSEVYRDAKDPATAYYLPVLRLGKRENTALAGNLGSLASSLDGFLFRYIGFDTKQQSYIKYGDVQAVVEASQPQDITLESVQSTWKEVTRLVPIPLQISGVRMRLPYPERTVILSEVSKQASASDPRWCFGSIATPTPQLLNSGGTNFLREPETKDFANAITSDLSELPAFQPVLEVNARYSGWVGASPQMRAIGAAFLGTGGISLIRSRVPKSAPPAVIPMISGGFKMKSELPGGHSPMYDVANAGVAQYAVYYPDADSVPLQFTAGTPGVSLAPMARGMTIRVNPVGLRALGKVNSRKDVDYKFIENQEFVSQIPLSFPLGVPNNDYFFYSRDSKRYGWHPDGGLPYEVPQAATPPEGFAYWYRSHFTGRQIIWPAPNELRLRWNADKGVQPSCRFYLTGGDLGQPLMAHIEYDLYPSFSMSRLGAAVADIRKQTGEQVDLRPFTDIVSADQMTLVGGLQTLRDLIQAKRLTIQKLLADKIDDAWFTVTVDIPAEDWPAFTIFMKGGDLGTWDFGFKQSASSGVGDKVSFELNADLLDTLGGPLLISTKNYDTATGGYEIAMTNFGLTPLAVKGIRFMLTGSEKLASLDSWFPTGGEKTVPAVPTASSFDTQEGTGQVIEATVKESSCADLKAAWASGSFQRMDAQLTSDMVGLPPGEIGADPDIAFAYLRSLCYRYAGQSNMIDIPVAPAEQSQWLDYKGGRVVLRFQGFVYSKQIDVAAEKNLVTVRRLPKEGAYANWGLSNDLMDKLDYRAVFVRKDGSVVTMPSQDQGPAWLSGDTSGIILDMTQVKRVRPVRPGST